MGGTLHEEHLTPQQQVLCTGNAVLWQDTWADVEKKAGQSNLKARLHRLSSSPSYRRVRHASSVPRVLDGSVDV